jgi:uridylate kinase
MEKGRTVIFAAGTGQAFQTTDTAAALRALEIGADALLMAKNGVDGVYDSDPKHNPKARKFDKLTHHQALTLRLKALDSSALSYCMENDLPIVVFNMFEPGNLKAVIEGRPVGTLITESEPQRTQAAAAT